MDYVVGSVAALISGNVTPNRPKLARRALTPTKHQPSPNVTPKSEFVDDRSVFLSPSVQKKKAIVKKSPKRIFQNPDLDITGDSENNPSPKADKVKKHLKEDLESGNPLNTSAVMLKSSRNKQRKSEEGLSEEMGSPQSTNENIPKKKKKRHSVSGEDVNNEEKEQEMNVTNKKKKKQKSANVHTSNTVEKVGAKEEIVKKKKNNSISEDTIKNKFETSNESNKTLNSPKKKNKKQKKKNNSVETKTQEVANEDVAKTIQIEKDKIKKKKKRGSTVNPNAITNKDTDSEHESDDDIHSENEEVNKEILDTGPAEDSSDEEDIADQKKTNDNEETEEFRTEEEIKRTLFVGNVPFGKKCKKDVKKIFRKYGQIDTIRIRTIPVKDARVTPKVAVIKNELHPERTTVNVYIKFKDEISVAKALAENNTVLNGYHLRVTRSESTGAEHDPRCSVFVGNVPFALEDETFREKFSKCGEVVSVRIIRDRKSNVGKGFGYVNFASKDGVELALALSEEDLTIKNRILRVKRCTQITQRQKNQAPGNKNLHNKNQEKGQFGNKGFKSRGPPQEGMGEGAQRRLMKKRKNQDGGDGPPEKKQNLYQPQKEKKVRKEFVGMTAEKKKKHTFNKGQKKKRALSQILTK